ncbi:MAG: alpha/beta fold hydrolase [Thermogutta sp.]
MSEVPSLSFPRIQWTARCCKLGARLASWILAFVFIYSFMPAIPGNCGENLRAAESIRFVRHAINPESEFTSCAVFDVNGDGQMDIVAGGWWYEGPTWKKHFLRDVPQIRGRYDDYSNLPLDVNGDGWTDIISANYRSEGLFWIEHPGPRHGPWTVHLIEKPGPMETGRLYDIDGDGALDILPNGAKFAAWWQLRRGEEGAIDWVRHDLPAEIAGHGIGFGDINGDGRGDVVTPMGWWEAPRDVFNGAWVAHKEWTLHHDASIPIIVHDIDGDGDQDVMWGRGHRVGLYWLEQISDGDLRRWALHVIDTSYSQIHAILVADLDGDGRAEFVAGKRYLGHDGRDPGEWNPLGIYWYRFDRVRKTFCRQVIDEGGPVGFGLDPKAADIDADGDVDLVASDRSGLYLLENAGRGDSRTEAQLATTATEEGPWLEEDHHNLLMYIDDRGQPRRVVTLKDWGIRRSHILRGMMAVMGPLPGPERRVPLNVKILSEETTDSYRRVKLTYASDESDHVPAYLLIPRQTLRRMPAALCLHQTTHLAKDEPAGTHPDAAWPYAHELALRGFVCLVPDYPSFGEHAYAFKSHPEYFSGTMKAIWDNVRAIDLLESLPEVDRDRIAVIGHSLGGHNALFTAAFDERIRAVICSCGFTGFGDYYGGKIEPWAQDRYMPRIRTVFENDPNKVPFDFHEVIAAIAPRPIFINAPLHDANFDCEGVKKVLAVVEPIDQLHNAPHRIHVVYPDAEHSFPAEIRQAAYEWLEAQLGMTSSSR